LVRYRTKMFIAKGAALVRRMRLVSLPRLSNFDQSSVESWALA